MTAKPSVTFWLLNVIVKIAFYASFALIPVVLGVTIKNYKEEVLSVNVAWNTIYDSRDYNQAVALVKSGAKKSVIIDKKGTFYFVPASLRYWIYLELIAGPVVLIYFLFLLKSVFNSIEPDIPFHPQNSKRIYLMGILFIAVAVYEGFTRIWMNNYLNTNFDNLGRNLNLERDHYGSLFFGLILIAISQVHRRGVQLTQENQLTI